MQVYALGATCAFKITTWPSENINLFNINRSHRAQTYELGNLNKTFLFEIKTNLNRTRICTNLCNKVENYLITHKIFTTGPERFTLKKNKRA